MSIILIKNLAKHVPLQVNSFHNHNNYNRCQINLKICKIIIKLTNLKIKIHNKTQTAVKICHHKKYKNIKINKFNNNNKIKIKTIMINLL